MDRKKIRNDIILIGSLIVVAVIALVLVLTIPSKSKNIAKIYVRDTIVETIDLSKKENKYFDVTGTNGKVKVHTKDGKIAIIESNCPHQDCVHMGYVDTPNRPIICAYNGVYVIIEGASSSDVVIG